MKAPEYITTDVPFMEAMICECDTELKKIKNDIKEYIKEHNTKYITDDFIGQYFLEKCVDLHFGEDSRKTEKAIKRLGIHLAKAKKVIDTTAWETAFEHATEDVNIVEVVRHYLGDFNPRRRLKCCFHVSRDGGGKHMQVYEKSNSFHCFSCGASGDSIEFVMRTEGCSFKEAVEILNRF